MKENLPQKYEKNFLKKIFHKIRIFFCSKYEEKENVSNNAVKLEKNIREENEFTTQVKVNEDIKSPEFEKEQFMKKLTNNPNLLENFSNDRLEKILQYYLNENNKKRETLKRLNS